MKMTGTGSITQLRALQAERRVVRQRRRTLQEELSTFRSPSERAELNAIISRVSTEQTQGLEALLNGADAAFTS